MLQNLKTELKNSTALTLLLWQRYYFCQKNAESMGKKVHPD